MTVAVPAPGAPGRRPAPSAPLGADRGSRVRTWPGPTRRERRTRGRRRTSPGSASGCSPRTPRRRPDAALDAGCGTGRHVAYTTEAGVDRVGFDCEENMTAFARERRPGPDYRVDDMRSLRPGRAFDAVTCFGWALSNLHTDADVSRSVETFAVHCRPGALLFAHVPNPLADPVEAAFQRHFTLASPSFTATAGPRTRSTAAGSSSPAGGCGASHHPGIPDLSRLPAFPGCFGRGSVRRRPVRPGPLRGRLTPAAIRKAALLPPARLPQRYGGNRWDEPHGLDGSGEILRFQEFRQARSSELGARATEVLRPCAPRGSVIPAHDRGTRRYELLTCPEQVAQRGKTGRVGRNP